MIRRGAAQMNAGSRVCLVCLALTSHGCVRLRSHLRRCETRACCVTRLAAHEIGPS
jgi:hypothetical protein